MLRGFRKEMKQIEQDKRDEQGGRAGGEIDVTPKVDDKVKVTVVEVDDQAAAEAALKDEDADAWLHPLGDGWQLTSESSEQDALTDVTSVVVRQQVLADNAASVGSTVEALEAGSTVTTNFLRGDAEKASVAEAVGFVFVVARNFRTAITFACDDEDCLVRARRNLYFIHK